MDTTPTAAPLDALSYDDNVPYEEQVSPPDIEAEGTGTSSLMNRIARNKVYLLSESAAPRATKRKHEDEEENALDDEDTLMDDDLTLRQNALLLHGPPIAHLPTARLFAYATHYDARPLGLEWVDDTTCVLVFSSARAARSAFAKLVRATDAPAGPDADGYFEAHRVPTSLWPARALISKSVRPVEDAGGDVLAEGTVGTNTELSAPIRLRYARTDDVKKRGAAKESRFYAKHGATAGKEVFNPATGRVEVPAAVEDAVARKRRRAGDAAHTTAQDLDNDLDAFLAEGSPPPGEEGGEPSRMRADGFDPDAGRSLLDRTSVLRAHPEVSSGAERRRGGRRTESGSRDRRDGGHRRDGGGSNPRPKRTLQELDDELDAFLNER